METEWSISRYQATDRPLWDDFVANSRQGTLLHMRGYMDYHADRFRDCSLIAMRNGRPTAILPANIDEKGTLHSHQGLTYGGWLTPTKHFDGDDMLRLFEAWRHWCMANSIHEIIYKTVPHIYHKIPAEEDIYALFRNGAEIHSTNLSSTIDMRVIPVFNTQQRRNLNKALQRTITVRETSDVSAFMPMLEECLKTRHETAPVHNTGELQTLIDRFPENIRIFIAESNGTPEAGVCIYDTNGTAHCQYIATSEKGRENGALTFLMQRLISEFFVGRRYFDFGTSNEDSGRVLNAGLLHQKTGLGGRGVAYNTFKLNFDK